MANNAHPRMSVIIPLYNHEKFVGEAIQSVLNQSFSDFELIVINDGSTDHSESVVKDIRDDRITYVSQANQGASHTINQGILQARGEYISILNSDDLYYKERLAEAFRLLESDQSLQAVFSHIEVIDGEGKFTKFVHGAEANWSTHHPDTSFKGANDIVLDLLAGNFLMTTSNLVCRKGVFDEIGDFADLRYTHDYEFFLRLCHRSKVYVIENPLLKYRIHAANSLKESEADVTFEIGIVLTEFLVKYGLDRVYRHEPREDVALMKLFNSIATCRTEKMMTVLLLSVLKNRDGGEQLLRDLSQDRENVLRRACVDGFQKHIDLWQDSQEAWRQWSQMNDRLTETNERLIEINDRLAEYRRSYPYRLWRLLTWPRRKLLAITQSTGNAGKENRR